MSTVVSHVIASKMKPSDSEASIVGSMLKTILLTNCPGEYTSGLIREQQSVPRASSSRDALGPLLT